jgi:hypothetical protein
MDLYFIQFTKNKHHRNLENHIGGAMVSVLTSSRL